MSITLDKVVFEIVTEDGLTKATFADIRKNRELAERIGRQSRPPQGRSTLFLGKTILSFPTAMLMADPRKKRQFDDATRMYEENPLRYFVPQSQVVLEFLNWRWQDATATMKVFHAGVGCGKSVAAWIDCLLQIIPCDPSWPIFTDFGVRHRTYRGPYTDGGVAVVSYELKNHENTLWPQVIRRWTPRQYIQDYLEGKKTISWRAGPKVVIADTPVFFMVSSQKDTAFVSQALDVIWWDEQSTEDKFLHANDRVRRRGGRHVCSLTPHCIEGRADTGAGSYLDRIRKGEMDVGLNVKFFQGCVDDIAPWVVTHEDKERLKRTWIEDPMRVGDRKRLAQGKAMVYGEFHEASGLVIDDFDPHIHIIPPFEVPDWWTFYRYHDHGRKEPNACILVAVNENDDYFIINEWYGRDKEIRENVQGIIETMTGNEIDRTDRNNPVERMIKRDIIRTVSDRGSISKAMDDAKHTMLDEYRREGLILTPGTTQKPYQLVPLASALFAVDKNKRHFVTKEPGAPRIYIFSTCVEFRREIEKWRMKRVRTVAGNAIVNREVPESKDDHLMRCLLELAADNPVHIPKWHKDIDINEEKMEDEADETPRDQITGY